MPHTNWKEGLLKIHYEPVHEEGGICWCGVTYSKEEDGKMHITHKEQRDVLTGFIESLLVRVREEIENMKPLEGRISREAVLEVLNRHLARDEKPSK